MRDHGGRSGGTNGTAVRAFGVLPCLSCLSRFAQPVYNGSMSDRSRPPVLSSAARWASVLSERLSEEKRDEIRLMSSEQRLFLALELSDACLELQRVCSPKR